jgi:hypothetical protein
MTDPSADRATTEDADTSTVRPSVGGMPRWVKVSLIVAALLIAVFAVLKVAHVGPEHGPQRHVPGMHGDTSGR